MIRSRVFIFVLLGLGMVLHTQTAGAWGSRGHRIIIALAQQHLSAASSAKLRELLAGEDLATASTWADEMRSSTSKPEFWSRSAANWHYVNVPAGSRYADSAKNPRGDAYTALQTFTAIVMDKPVPRGPVREALVDYFGKLDADPQALKAFALRFMLHIIADLQQPLHCGYADDRGGNAVALTWFGEPTNLHTVWDRLLLSQMELSLRAHTRRLSRQIARSSGADIRQLASAEPLVWISEAQQLLPPIYGAHQHATTLGAAYVADFSPTVEAQLRKGGLRTASYLNQLFATPAAQ